MDTAQIYGRVAGVRGLMVEVAGPVNAMPIGARVVIEVAPGRLAPCEVVGFSGSNALLLPFARLEGVRRGCKATVSGVAPAARPSAGWLRSRAGGPCPLGGGGRDLRRAGADAAPGGLSDARDRGIFPRRAKGRAGFDGFGDAFSHGAARDRAISRRASDRERIHPDGFHRAAAAAGTCGSGGRAGYDHRHVHGAGRRR